MWGVWEFRYPMSNGVEELPEVLILLCVLIHSRGIENEVVRHGEQGRGIGGVFGGLQVFAADHAISLSLGAGNPDVVE